MATPEVLKIRAARSDALCAFMNEFEECTQQHPLAGYMRVWEGTVSFEVKQFDGYIILGCIQSLEPGNGNASKALDWLVLLAKNYSVIIKGNVQPLGNSGLGRQALRSWYKRHGFRVQRNGDIYFIPKVEARGGAGRGQGRKPLSPGEETVLFSVKLPVSQRDKLVTLGGAEWVRKQIDNAGGV